MKTRFHIRLSQSVLDDLKLRLEMARWPDTVDISDWNYGTNLAYLKDLVSYWLHDFDWRQQEQRLNQFHHYQALIGGLKIHFIHEPGKGPHPLPIVLTHGWPSSFYEMSKIIPLLVDPAGHGGDAADALTW
ncbi:epoxide hydrolase N-terminal domain-containing protein [Sulfobacillus harzensis]|uniref:epoxide hydrolase N-terminal domain-containing protein n=1 Tax=Sulfobacillus harzensis TaxID=2729629 RepID=UPI0030845046